MRLRLRRRASGATHGLDAATAREGRPTACWAPATALYFQPDGIVRTCCASSFALGQITRDTGGSTLTEIWRGANRAALRESIAAEDFGLGCEECGVPIARGQRAASLAAHFDEFAPFGDRWPSAMDFALSNRCNLACVMCNGELSSTIRRHREHRDPLPSPYGDAFFAELADFVPHLRKVNVKGGEPFLAPESFRLWDLLLRWNPDCRVSVTTNGTRWNGTIEHYVRALRMHVIVSVDGMTAETLESIRLGVDFDELWRHIDRFQAVTEETGAGLSLSWCLLRSNWHEVGDFLLECDRRGVNANVVVVSQPPDHALASLPAGEVDEVVDGLERLDTSIAPLLTASASEWESLLRRVRSLRAEPVHIRRRPLPTIGT